MFVKHSCHRCNAEDESMFTVSGKHIKQTCNSCGSYVKFYPQSELPALTDVRSAIWTICECDVNVIDEQKKLCNFTKPDTPVFRFTQYWKLYIQCRKTFGIIQ